MTLNPRERVDHDPIEVESSVVAVERSGGGQLTAVVHVRARILIGQDVYEYDHYVRPRLSKVDE